MRHNDLHGSIEGLRTDPSADDQRRSLRAQVRASLNLAVLEERYGWPPEIRAELIQYFGLEKVDASVRTIKETIDGGDHHQQG